MVTCYCTIGGWCNTLPTKDIAFLYLLGCQEQIYSGSCIKGMAIRSPSLGAARPFTGPVRGKGSKTNVGISCDKMIFARATPTYSSLLHVTNIISVIIVTTICSYFKSTISF